MRPIKIFSYLLLLSLCWTACRTSKIAKQSAKEKVLLKNAVYQLVDCLNTRDEACLKQLYAQDFESYAPVIEFSSIEKLVEKTVQNFEKNQFQVSITILDITVGTKLAYVVLEWELMETQANGVSLSLLVEKRLDIWKKEEELAWQLHRSLFYKPKSY